MPFFLSSKPEQSIEKWKSAVDFVDSFRDELRLFSKNSLAKDSIDYLEKVKNKIAELADKFADCEEKCGGLVNELSFAADTAFIKSVAKNYYDILYQNISDFHSSLHFYGKSHIFLSAATEAISLISKKELGIAARNLPEMALIALGPAGRKEFSPFCPLQIIIVHAAASKGIENEAARQFGRLLHQNFEASGFRIDSNVSPISGDWTLSLDDWKSKVIKNDGDDIDEIIALTRLADQIYLSGSQKIAESFRITTIPEIAKNRTVIENLVSRVTLLSNGLGILGRLKLEKSGPYSGRFPLLDHALQPLTGAISAFALIKELNAMSSIHRIKEMLSLQIIGVENAEKLLAAWFNINEIRLLNEKECANNWQDNSPLHINIEKLPLIQQDRLIDALETIGFFQRYLYSYFNSQSGQ